MAELLVERGQIPGDSPQTLTGLDNTLHDTTGRWSIMTTRMCGGVIVLDRGNWEPVCFLYAPGSGESKFPSRKSAATRTRGKSSSKRWEIPFMRPASIQRAPTSSS